MATKRKKELDVFVTLQQYEALKSEFSACKRKLKSKEEAVKILHRELELCQEEKEEFARLMNHMKDYYLEGQTYLLSPVSTVDDELVDFQDESVDLSVKVVQLEALVKKMKLKHKEDVQVQPLLLAIRVCLFYSFQYLGHDQCSIVPFISITHLAC
jgi:DNA polymerase III delta prime subunit